MTKEMMKEMMNETMNETKGGSISALGLPVRNWYSIGKTSDKLVKMSKNDLILLDIQYLG